MTVEMWRNKSPFTLILNTASFRRNCVALQTLDVEFCQGNVGHVVGGHGRNVEQEAHSVEERQ